MFKYKIIKPIVLFSSMAMEESHEREVSGKSYYIKENLRARCGDAHL
jgi:hypothetical protein